MSFCTLAKRNVISSPIKGLFFSFLKTQSKTNTEMLKANYKTLTCKSVSQTIFFNVKSPINSRSFRVTSLLKEKTVTITFLKHDGTQFKKEAPVGKRFNKLFDVDGEIPGYGVCGGHQQCGTCHLLFPKEIIAKLGEQSIEELDTICYANGYDREFSRLGCCVTITEDMDGAVLRVPEITGDRRDLD